MNIIANLHESHIFRRRIRTLAQHLAILIPEGARVLDVGCGDGRLDRLLGELRPDLDIQGIEVMVRPITHVPVTAFDGNSIPFKDRSFDVVMFVDVLHHTPDPTLLLKEAKRVARQGIVFKDHCLNGFLAGATLRFMDWVGNAHHGVVLPYNYWPEKRWRQAFQDLQLDIDAWNNDLRLYPQPFSFLFDRQLHFVARLKPLALDRGRQTPAS